MKILWITNIVFPEAQGLLKGDGSLKASGGWMLGAAEALAAKDNITLVVATVSSDVKQLTKLKGERIEYYLIPYGRGNYKYNASYESYWKVIDDAVRPDVIHIHGSEFSHGLAYVRACGNERVVVSIQGLVSVIERYYTSGLSRKLIYTSVTLRGLLGHGILSEQRRFKMRGELEKKLLNQVRHIIGRTTWDRAHALVINPQAQYYHVGETLRSEFYEGKWDYQECNHHSIFLSQANYSIKGLHVLLQAMPYVLERYPDTIIRVAGKDITKCSNLNELLHYSDYGRIIHRMVKKYKLEKSVFFIGSLDAEGMKQEYLKANVFVCPSSIENSPNSVGEAQLLSVPVIAAYVGGVPDMMKDDESHMYRFEESEMLAALICDVFNTKEKQPQVIHMREQALDRHDPIKNISDLLYVYNLIKNN